MGWDVNKAADADMAGQGYSHLTMMRTRVRGATHKRMTHLCWSQAVGAFLLVYRLKEAGKVR